MRAVLDPNVIISSLLSPDGAPARVVQAWAHGAFELIVSPLLLEELERALAYPKLRARIDGPTAERVVAWIRAAAIVAPDPAGQPPVRSPDPGDDYLIALAEAERAALVSGDGHLLGPADALPVYSPGAFLELVSQRGDPGYG